jgi:hypothetical protein
VSWLQFGVAANSSNHLATTALQEQGDTFVPYPSPQLTRYTVDTQGNISTTNTWEISTNDPTDTAANVPERLNEHINHHAIRDCLLSSRAGVAAFIPGDASGSCSRSQSAAVFSYGWRRREWLRLSTGVTLYSNPGITLVCYQSVSAI